MRSRTIAPLVAVLSLLVVPAAASPMLGMIDTFQSGTTEGWFAGGGPFQQVPPIPPHVVDTGGPTGANDAYLEIVAVGGQGAGSRLVAMNATQWTGDFTGIPTIEMDVFNLGPTDLTLRLLFENPAGGAPTDVAITSAGIGLPAGSGWMHVTLAIDALSLTPLLGDVGALLANVTLMRLIHSPVAAFPPPGVFATLGVDNISAGAVPRPGPFPDVTPVPEPATIALLGSGLASMLFRKRRRAGR